MSNNVVLDKSKAFAIRIVKLYQWMEKNKTEFVLGKQLLRSGTSIGAKSARRIMRKASASLSRR